MNNPGRAYDISVGAEIIRIELPPSGGVLAGGRRMDAELRKGGDHIFELRIGGKNRQIYIRKREDSRYEIWIERYVVEVTLLDERARLLARFERQRSSVSSQSAVRAPMPGFVSSVKVK